MEVKIKRNQNSGGKEGLKNYKVKKHIECHQGGEIRRKRKYEALDRKYNKEKRNKNSDRRAETATPCKNSKTEEI